MLTQKTGTVGLAGALIFMVACGGDDKPPPQTPPPPPPVTTTPPPPPPVMTAETPPPPKKSLAEMQQAAGKALAEAFAAQDGAKMAALYTENAVVKNYPQELNGREAIAKSMEGMKGSISKVQIKEARVFVKGEVVVSEWVANAVHSGPMMGVKATEKPIGMQSCSILWFTPEGLIKEDHTYRNLATIASQIGASKEKGRAVPALPSAAPEVIVAKDSPEEKANIEIIEKINKAWEAKKEADVAALFTNDGTWDDVTMLTPAKGTNEIKKYVGGFIKAFPDGKLTTTNAWGFGDWVVEEGTYSGTHKGTLAGMAPTNKPFTIHEVTVAKVGADKKVVQATTYGNDFELYGQIDPKSLPGAKPDAKDAPKADPKKPEPAKK